MDEVDSLLVEVRASTQGFEEDIGAMRGALDTKLLDGFPPPATCWSAGC